MLNKSKSPKASLEKSCQNTCSHLEVRIVNDLAPVKCGKMGADLLKILLTGLVNFIVCTRAPKPGAKKVSPCLLGNTHYDLTLVGYAQSHFIVYYLGTMT